MKANYYFQVTLQKCFLIGTIIPIKLSNKGEGGKPFKHLKCNWSRNMLKGKHKNKHMLFTTRYQRGAQIRRVKAICPLLKNMWLLQHADCKNRTLCPTDITHCCHECSKLSCHRTESRLGHKLGETSPSLVPRRRLSKSQQPSPTWQRWGGKCAEPLHSTSPNLFLPHSSTTCLTFAWATACTDSPRTFWHFGAVISASDTL